MGDQFAVVCRGCGRMACACTALRPELATWRVLAVVPIRSAEETVNVDE